MGEIAAIHGETDNFCLLQQTRLPWQALTLWFSFFFGQRKQKLKRRQFIHIHSSDTSKENLECQTLTVWKIYCSITPCFHISFFFFFSMTTCFGSTYPLGVRITANQYKIPQSDFSFDESFLSWANWSLPGWQCPHDRLHGVIKRFDDYENNVSHMWAFCSLCQLSWSFMEDFNLCWTASFSASNRQVRESFSVQYFSVFYIKVII